MPMLLNHPEFLNPDRLPVAVTAIVVVMLAGAVTGPVRGYAGPLLWYVFDITAGKIGRRLDRPRRSRRELVLRGAGFAMIVFFVFLWLGGFARGFVWNFPHYDIAEILLLSICLSSGAVWHAAWQLFRVLKKKANKQGAYYAVARSTGLDLSYGDDYGITRVAISYSIRMLPMAMVAPVFWYLIGGLPLAYAYCGIAALAWYFGRDGYGNGFGNAGLWLEMIAGFIPMLLSAIFVNLASVISPTLSIARSIKSWFAGDKRASYAEGGAVLSCAAWAMNISLGGPVTTVNGDVLKKRWIGSEGTSARLDASHVKRTLYMLFISHLVMLAVLAVAMAAA
jgi:adenosylcobinamide-phosphate synthase